VIFLIVLILLSFATLLIKQNKKEKIENIKKKKMMN